MAAPLLKSRTFTPEEYLILERQADYKSEYVAGEVYAMAGASPKHNLITANVVGELRALLKSKPCRTLASDMKVKAIDSRLFSYPDVTVVCGEMRFLDDRQDVLLNPTIVVEVLSPSTLDFDLGRKRAAYASLESVNDVLMVYQDEPKVVYYARQSVSEWLTGEVKGLGGEIQLTTHGIVLSMAEIYDKVEFESGTD